MCRIDPVQLGKQRRTLIKKLSLKTTTCIANWQDRENKIDFPDLAQLGNTTFLALV